MKNKFRDLAIIGFSVFCTWTAYASDVEVQKIPLTFRSGNTPGIIAELEFNGEKLPFLIDSGSSGHVLDSKIAKKLRLQSSGKIPGSTPYGAVHMTHIGDIQAKMKDVSIKLIDCLSDSLEPGGLRGAGIVGLLSPQKLAVDSLIVLNMSEPAMYMVKPIPKDIYRWLTDFFKKHDFEILQRQGDRNDFREIVVAKTKVFGDLNMFLDSGATTTNIYSEKPFDSSEPLAIRIGNHECITTSANIHHAKSPTPLAHLLGMDCLRGKILAFFPPGSSSVWIGWPKE